MKIPVWIDVSIKGGKPRLNLNDGLIVYPKYVK